MEAIESHLMAAAKEEEKKVSETLILKAHKLNSTCHWDENNVFETKKTN